MAYEYATKERRDASESIRVMRELESKGFKPYAVQWKPETNTTVVYFDRQLSEEEKEKLDKAMKSLGYMVL